MFGLNKKFWIYGFSRNNSDEPIIAGPYGKLEEAEHIRDTLMTGGRVYEGEWQNRQEARKAIERLQLNNQKPKAVSRQRQESDAQDDEFGIAGTGDSF